jgi:hypothetical protein
MTTHLNFSGTSGTYTGPGDDQISKQLNPSNSGYAHDDVNKCNKDLSNFTYNNIIAHWKYVDKTAAKTYTEVILKLLWSGATFGELLDEHGTPRPGVTFVFADELEAEESDRINDLWLTCLPRWRLRRIENEVIKLLREYGWESSHIALTKGKGDEMVLEWEISLAAELIA